MTLAWAWSPQVNIRAKYEVTSEEFHPRGGQRLLSHAEVGLLLHAHQSLPSAALLTILLKSSQAKCLHITAFPQATPNRGAILSPWVAGQQMCGASLAHGKETQAIAPGSSCSCLLALCSSEERFMCTLDLS